MLATARPSVEDMRRHAASVRARLMGTPQRVQMPAHVSAAAMAVLHVLDSAGPRGVTFLAEACGLKGDNITTHALISTHLELRRVEYMSKNRRYKITETGRDALAAYEARL